MSSAKLAGPYRLTVDGIASIVPRGRAGTYLLGYPAPDGRFHVKNVGRAEVDLAEKLRACIGTAAMFKFEPMRSAREAFERECELFHDLRPPGNQLHPDRPAGTAWQCPRCLQAARQRRG